MHRHRLQANGCDLYLLVNLLSDEGALIPRRLALCRHLRKAICWSAWVASQNDQQQPRVIYLAIPDAIASLCPRECQSLRQHARHHNQREALHGRQRRPAGRARSPYYAHDQELAPTVQSVRPDGGGRDLHESGSLRLCVRAVGNKSATNVGFGFVNFVDSERLVQAWQLMEGQKWRMGSRSRAVSASVAHVQGLSQNLDHFLEHCDPADDRHLPLVFSSGLPIDILQLARRRAAAQPQLKGILCDGLTRSRSTSWDSSGSSAGAASGAEAHAMQRAAPGPAGGWRCKAAGTSPSDITPLCVTASWCTEGRCVSAKGVPAPALQREPGLVAGGACGEGVNVPGWRGSHTAAPGDIRWSPGYAVASQQVVSLLRELIGRPVGWQTSPPS